MSHAVGDSPAADARSAGRDGLGLAMATMAAAIVMWGVPACGVRIDEAGIEAAVLFELRAPADTVATDAGDQIEIERASLSVRSVELLLCEPTPERVGASLDDMWGPPRARAHTTETPTLLGVPMMVELDGVDGPASPGVFRPPPGEYCALRLSLGAPDESPEDDAAMIGGRFLDGSEMVGFVRGTRIASTVDVPMQRLVLRDPDDSVELRLSADAAEWLDAMILSQESFDDRVRLAEQVAASIDVRWVPVAGR